MVSYAVNTKESIHPDNCICPLCVHNLQGIANDLYKSLEGFEQISFVILKALERDGGVRAEMATEFRQCLGKARESLGRAKG